MSTRKTEHFGLHAWEAGDLFLRSEFNENFTALDRAIRAVFGAYKGDDTGERFFDLGFTPKAVFVITSGGRVASAAGGSANCLGGMALEGNPLGSLLVVTEGGFTVRHSTGLSSTNYSNHTYYFWAMW